jgi:hypothetical protein
MTFHDRFPHEYLRLDFFLNVLVLAFDALFFVTLLWDLIVSWSARHRLLRIGTAYFVVGIVGFRLYAVWGLWHFHTASISHQRIAADVFVMTANIVFIICWIADHFAAQRHFPRDPQLGGTAARAMTPEKG